MKNHRSLPNEWNMFKNYQSISRWIFLVDAETRWIIALQSGEKCEETVRKYYLYETKHCLISNRRCPSRKAVQYKFYLAFENSLCKDVSYRICDIVVLLAYLSLFLGLHNWKILANTSVTDSPNSFGWLRYIIGWSKWKAFASIKLLIKLLKTTRRLHQTTRTSMCLTLMVLRNWLITSSTSTKMMWGILLQNEIHLLLRNFSAYDI